MAPRRLPVFDEPLYPNVTISPGQSGCVADTSELVFVEGRPTSHALTLYSRGRDAIWSASGQKGLTLAAATGTLDATNGFEQRVAVRYDGVSAIEGGTAQCGSQTLRITARLIRPATPNAPVEINRTLSLAATRDTSPDWEVMPGLGSRGASLRARLDLPSRADAAKSAPLDYRFETGASTDAELRIIALPVHPLTSADGLRIAIQIDDGPLQTLDFRTFGRSEEWKQNVLTNSAIRSIPLRQLAKGAHHLRIHALDPGFILDRIDIRLDGAPDTYGGPPLR